MLEKLLYTNLAGAMLLQEKRSYSCTFSRHAKAETSFALVIWLNENVPNNTATMANLQLNTDNSPPRSRRCY